MGNSHALISHEIIRGRKEVAAIGIAFFALATMLGAFVRVPVPGSPVPITLQTFFVLLTGAVLGSRLGGTSQLVALLLASSCGAVSVLGPTGGYLIGFAAAAYLIGRLTEAEGAGLIRIISAFFAGSVVIYASGILWLVAVYRMDLFSAIAAGALPFIPGDIVKIFVAALLYRPLAGRSRALFPA